MSSDFHYLLTVDVGNSRVKFGLFDRTARTSPADQLPHCLAATAVPLTADISWTEICGWIDEADNPYVTGVVAGANPAGIDKVLNTWSAVGWPSPQVIDDPAGFPLHVALDSPRNVGIDRLLNAVAANAIRPADRPVIIVDTGTATTVDFVSADGAFRGGAILPGFELSARALHHYTALLPLITIEELARTSRNPLGRNTRDALYSGLFWGQLGAVRELISQLTESRISDFANPTGNEPFLLLTGGGALLLAAHLPEVHFRPHLSLQGLALVAEGFEI